MEKKWYQSKIFWASVVAIITGVAGMLTGEATTESAFVTMFGAVVAIFRLFFTNTNLTA